MVKEVKWMTRKTLNGWREWVVVVLLAIALGVTNWSVGREVERNDTEHAVIVETADKQDERLRGVENGHTELVATFKAFNATLLRIEKKLDER